MTDADSGCQLAFSSGDDDNDFFSRQARLQAEAKLALAQVQSAFFLSHVTRCGTARRCREVPFGAA